MRVREAEAVSLPSKQPPSIPAVGECTRQFVHSVVRRSHNPRSTFTLGVQGVKEIALLRERRVCRRAPSLFDAGSPMIALITSAVWRRGLRIGMGVRKGCRYAPVASPGRRAPGNGRKCRKYATEVGLREWSPVLRAPFRIERGVRCDRRCHGHVARTLGYPSVCVTGRGGPSFQVKSRSEREREHVDGGSRGESRRQVFAVCAVDQVV